MCKAAAAVPFPEEAVKEKTQHTKQSAGVFILPLGQKYIVYL